MNSNHPAVLRRLLASVLIVGQILLPLPALAVVVTDGTTGAVTTLSGAITIPQTLGTISGNNLFHSFGSFNINSGESANFTTTTAGLTNVISRVTGGTVSNINGALSLTPISGTPAFWFINPAGVTFGAGASINVPGAFHVSTANYIKFSDGNFYANTGSDSTFSSTDPVAFGFLGSTRSTIEINAGAILSSSTSTISVVAGDVTINNGRIENGSGDIRIVAFGTPAGIVSVSGALPEAEGTISVLNGGRISSSTSSSGNAGDVTVVAGNLTIDGTGATAGTTGLFSTTSGSGNAGNVQATVKNAAGEGLVSVKAGGVVSSSTTQTGAGGGAAGNVTVVADKLAIDGMDGGFRTTGLLSTTTGAGNAGTVTATVSDSLVVKNAGLISSTSLSGGTGAAGGVHRSTKPAFLPNRC